MVDFKIKATIAIPIYNAEKYLSFAINSVINQSYKEFELLLIDDGSSDDSLLIAKTFALRDNRIKVICDGNNKGLAKRINESVSMAQGEYYFRMDADDIMDICRLESQLNFLYKHPQIDVVGSSAIIIGPNNEILFGVKDNITAPHTRSEVERGSIFIHPSVAGKTIWFKEHPYDEKLRRSQDFFLWLNSVESSKFAILKETLLFYRVINDDIWGKFKRDNRIILNYYRSQLTTKHFWKPLMCCLKQEVRLPLFWLFYNVKGSNGVIRRRYKVLTEEEKETFDARLKKAIL